jgi:hypothetical protein
VEIGDRGGAGLGEVGQQMGLALGEAQRRLGVLQIQADPVGGAVDEGDELQSGLHDELGYYEFVMKVQYPLGIRLHRPGRATLYDRHP